MTEFTFRTNLGEVADKLGQQAEDIAGRVNSEMQNLSISTHAFVLRHANDNLEGWTRNHFFGDMGENVRWNQIAPNIWVVEIDESVAFIEEGRAQTFMGNWLLKDGAKGVKTAKDGSKYRVIPFSHGKGSDTQKQPELAAMIKKQLKNKGVTLSKLERNQWDKPRVGVLHKLDLDMPRSSYPQKHFSEPRSEKNAEKLGLKDHTGNFFLKNAVVVQRETTNEKGKKKVSRDVVTFRVISSKHEAEGRWMYPKIDPLNSIPEAYKYAESEWEKIVKKMESEFRGSE